MIHTLSRLKTGYTLLLMHVLLNLFSFSFVPLFLKEQGYPYYFLVLIFVMYAIVGIISIPLVRTYSLKTFLILGYACFLLMAVSYWFHVKYYSFFIYGILQGLTLLLYWIPMNYLFFNQSAKETNAVDSFWYMASSSVFGIFIPLIGALVIKHAGFSWIFAIAAILYLIPILFVIKKIPSQHYNVPLKEGFTEFHKLRTVTVLEGALQYFGGAIIPIYTLLFLKTELQIGGFLSYLGLLGFIVTFLFSRHSDKSQNRIGYLILLFIAMGLITFLFPFIHTAFWWVILSGLFTMLSLISSPLRLAVSMDVKKLNLSFWKTRELFLNIGRAVTLAISLMLFYYELYWPVFVVFGAIMLIYPFVVKYKVGKLQPDSTKTLL